MKTVLDHTQDLSGNETYRLTNLYSPPEFVKAASHDKLHGDPEVLPAHLYADQLNRTYPCHTGPAVWMSTLFFADKKANYKPQEATLIESRIDKAATWFHIKPICDELKTKIAQDSTYDLKQVGDDDFALVYTTDTEKTRHFPLRNGEEVKVASAWFDKYRDEFTFVDRNTIAKKILEKSAQYGVNVPEADMLAKSAGYGYCSGADIVAMLNNRAALANKSHPTFAVEMRKFAQIAVDNPAAARDAAVKIASVVDQFDRQTQLSRMYGEGGLDRPEDVLFQVTEKAANDFVDAHFQLTSGTMYEKAAFDELPLDHVQTWMGSEFADEIAAGGLYVDSEKIASIASTLPRGDAEDFDRMANAAGVSVFARDKASSAQGLTAAELADLAVAHELNPDS